MKSLQEINQLKSKLFSKKTKANSLTYVLAMARELGCTGELLGKDFEVRDSKGTLVYTIRQKPIKLKQLIELMKQFIVLKKLEEEEYKNATKRSKR